MTTYQRLEKVLNSVFEGEIDPSGITLRSNLRDDVGMNSIGMLYMVMGLEEEFGIKFKNTDFPELKTVADVVACIEAKLK
ncbi:MAG: acyl carrier protein [Clostridia bacterium]|nr:acyl carrier protein [Clostridia bacterium]